MMEIQVPERIPAQALASARAYLLGRQCADGGFSFYRSEYLEEPSLHDTWHAMAALHLLGTPVPRREAVVRFIVGQPVSSQPYALYFRVRGLDLLDSGDPESAAVRAAVAALAAPAPDPERADDPADALYHLRLVLWLKRYFGLPFPAQGIARSLLAAEHAGGGFGVPPNLIATRHALAVLALCDEMPRARTRAFVTRLATPGFGFRLTEDSFSPNLETTCSGISCCRRLRLSIPQADDALAFILNCQTGDGGFAGAPDALPDIALTHLALASLAMLASPLHT